jgi:hypothetical protein
MSTVTRKSHVTMLTHATGFSKNVLPKDRKLREIAEQRILKNQLRDIEQNLRKINDTDDLSYAPTS